MSTHILDKTKIWNVYGRIELHVYLNKKEKQGPDFDIIVVLLKLLLDSCTSQKGLIIPGWGGLFGGSAISSLQ
jgi:hypothetical protein